MDKAEPSIGERSENEKGGSNYDVGYRKPPRASQFAKGHSGNPNGRPKKSSQCF